MDELVQCPPQPVGEGEMIGFEVWTEVQARARRGEGFEGNCASMPCQEFHSTKILDRIRDIILWNNRWRQA